MMQFGSASSLAGLSQTIYDNMKSEGLLIDTKFDSETDDQYANRINLVKKGYYVVAKSIIEYIVANMEIKNVSSTITPTAISGTSAGVVPGALSITPVVVTATILQDNSGTGLVS